MAAATRKGNVIRAATPATRQYTDENHVSVNPESHSPSSTRVSERTKCAPHCPGNDRRDANRSRGRQDVGLRAVHQDSDRFAGLATRDGRPLRRPASDAQLTLHAFPNQPSPIVPTTEHNLSSGFAAAGWGNAYGAGEGACQRYSYDRRPCATGHSDTQ